MPKLYELPRNTMFTIKNEDSKTKYLLDHLDGAYSFCYRDFDHEVIHLGASTEVDIINETNLA